MKKSKLAIGLMTAVMSCGALAGCDKYPVKYSEDGVILRYFDKETQVWAEITADELLNDYYDEESKYSTIFDTIYSIVVRNYFNSDNPEFYNGDESPKEQMKQIDIDATFDVESAERTAQKNADNNNTSYKDEWDAILSSNGVETKDELYNKFVLEHQKKVFENNFNEYHIEELKKGDKNVKVKSTLDPTATNVEEKSILNGYFDEMVPYHISHILLKLDDSANTNYSNGTISEENVVNLYNFINELKDGKSSFEALAKRYSTDPGSSAKWGDLGIVDYNTGFIDEFLLGLYTYENLLVDSSKTVNDQFNVDNSIVAMPGISTADVTRDADGKVTSYTRKVEGQAKQYVNLSNEANYADISETLAIPSISLDTVKELYSLRDVTKVDKKSVLDDNANFYPRNIMYNKYLNKHTLSLITDTYSTDVEPEEGALTGFVTKEINGVKTNVLCAKTNGEWSPILVARGESGGTNGLFFIIVNRSPFEETRNGTNLSDYYTTYYPAQEKYYPKDSDGNQLVTYINYANPNIRNDSKDKERADSLKSSIQSYNTDAVKKYLYTKYSSDIEIKDAKLREALNKWVYRNLEKSEEERTENWEKKWNSYLETLTTQNLERSKLVSEVCKIGYAHATDDDYKFSSDEWTKAKEFLEQEGVSDAKIEEILGTDYSSCPSTMKDLFKKNGGLCNDGKDHI